MSAVPVDLGVLEPYSSPLSKISSILLGISIAALAAMAILLFAFAVPVWDDLVRATRPVEIGWWRYVIGFVYHYWQGRWASCGLESFILPRVDITRFYWVLIATVAAVDAMGVYVICRWFTPLASRKASAGLAAGLLALLWAGLPSLGETVYWFTGAVENAMVLSLAVMVLVALLNFPAPSNDHRLKQTVQIAALSVAAVIICGFHELYGSMFGLALGVGMLASFKIPTANKTAWTAVTFAAAIGLAIVVLAPGNSFRIASDGSHHSRQFLYDLRVALGQVRHEIPRWLIDPKLIAATVFVIFSPLLRANCRSWTQTSPIPWRWIIPAAWAIMLALGFYAPSWAFGDKMPARTLSAVYVVFVIGWLLIVYLWSMHLGPTLKRIAWKGSSITSWTNVAFAISLLIFGNFTTTRRDFRDRMRPWHAAVENRYACLRGAAGTDALIKVLPKPPWILLNGEIVNDAGDYRNWSTVCFFHLRSIRIQPETGSPTPPPLHPTRPPSESKGF